MWAEKQKDDECFIKHEIIDEIEQATENCGEHNFAWKTWEHKSSKSEQRHLSQLFRQMENYTQSDLAVAVIIALENFPEMVIELVKDYIREKIVNKER